MNTTFSFHFLSDCIQNCSFQSEGRVYYSGEQVLTEIEMKEEFHEFMRNRLPDDLEFVPNEGVEEFDLPKVSAASSEFVGFQKVALFVVSPVLVVILVLIIIFLICCRRRNYIVERDVGFPKTLSRSGSRIPISPAASIGSRRLVKNKGTMSPSASVNSSTALKFPLKKEMVPPDDDKNWLCDKEGISETIKKMFIL
jgi:hypothetical protein